METVNALVHFEYCSVAKENITKYYAQLTNIHVDSMLAQLYAKRVITEKEKEMIDTLHLKSKKMEYLLDSVIIPSLANKVPIKFEGFLEVMKKSDDQILIDMAIKLGIDHTKPQIMSHPQDVHIPEGHRLLLEVTACGAMPLHYQWYFEYSYEIPGGTDPSYCIFPVTIREKGHYYCRVKNHYGDINSRIATVTVAAKQSARYDSKSPCFPTPMLNRALIMPHTQYTTPSRNSKTINADSDQESILSDCEDCEKLESTFSNYADKICDTLKEEIKDFRKVRRRCAQNVNVTGTMSLPKDIRNQILNANNFDDLFDILCCTPYWNWMNIRMLERMAGDCPAAKQLIEGYKNKVFSRKVKDVISEIPNLKVPKGVYTEVKVKWDKNFNDLTIKDIVTEWNDIEKKFNVDETMVLKSITEGCVEVCWLLPNHLTEHAIYSIKQDNQSDTNTQELFPEMLYLKISDAVIKDEVMNDEELSIAIDTLSNHYIRKETFLSEYEWPISCFKHYTPLSIFIHKEKYTESETATTARMLTSIGTMTHEHDSSVYGKITENISDIFAPFDASYPYTILVEGAAGIGKTTLCKEITLQWANKVILQNKDMLFLLSMHDPKIGKIVNVELLVKHVFQSEILANKITDWLIETDGKHLIIIIDGYSEDYGNKFIIDDIIGRKILTRCSIVITSRLAASLHFYEVVNHKALILGFTKNNQVSFINNALKGSDFKINHLKDYLYSNPIIDNLCCIPLIMNLLLWFVEEEKSKLKNVQTKLIQKYIMTIIKKKVITNFTDLPHPYDQVIENLSQLAFVAVQKDHTFTEDEILESCKICFQGNWHKVDFLKIMCDLGLFNMISQDVHCKLFYFSHVTIQEYLAAYYISLLSGGKLLKMLYDTFWTIHFSNVCIMYIGITGGKNPAFKLFLSGDWSYKTSSMSLKMPSNKIEYCLYQLHCLKEADGDLDKTLLGQNIDLKQQKLSHDHLHMLAALLSRSTNKKWEGLNVSGCGIDNQGFTILNEVSAKLKIDTVDISYNNFHWESFFRICHMFKVWNTKKLVVSVDNLYNTKTVNAINNFIAILEKNFQNDIFSDGILLLTYLPKQNKLIAVYSAPTHIRWFQWADYKLNEDMIKHIKSFTESKVENSFKLVFTCSVIDHINIENMSSLLSDIENVQLCGSYLHSKGAYLLKIASTIDCQYNSPEEVIADYLAAVLSYNIQLTMPYLESIPAAKAIEVKNAVQSALSSIFSRHPYSRNVFDISHNYINSQIATEIKNILQCTSTLQEFHASHNSLLNESIITIAKGLQNFSTLSLLNISNNNIGEEAADDIAKVLSHNTNLQELYLHDNSFKTVGIIKIAQGLQNVSTLRKLTITNNNVGEEAADDIATVLSHNTHLQVLHLDNNRFETVGMIKIAKALKNVLTLTSLNISENNVGEEAADDIATVLSHNTHLQVLHLDNNRFETVGMIKIAKALKNVLTLTSLNISKNNVGEEAADDIATVLFHSTNLQELFLHTNNFKTVGIIKIAKALRNVSTLTAFSIGNNDVDQEAAKDIATVLSHNTKLRTLHLRDNSFKAIGMIKIAKALQNVSTLRWFSISSNYVDEKAADDIATALSHNTELQELYLNNNSFKTIGIIKITKDLQDVTTLTVFNISSLNVGEGAAADIATVLFHNTKLQKLHLQNNNLNTVGMIEILKALQNISTLIVLNISNNNVGEEAADDIATVLSHNTNLQKLYLHSNNFKTVGMIKIAKGLQSVSTLMVLNISDNNVGDEAADDIATVLSHNTRLQKLHVHNNKFQSAGAIKITEALKNASFLAKYNISGNYIEREVVKTLRNILSWNVKLNLCI